VPAPSTNVYSETIQSELDRGNANTAADCFRKMLLGSMLCRLKAVVTGMTAASTVNITTILTALGAAVVTVTGINLQGGDLKVLPPILALRSLRITASGTAGSLGTYVLSDVGGTAIVPPGGAGAAVGIVTLSDDGTTITFPNTITAFTIEYLGGSNTDMTTFFEPSPSK
jgi:hypothetical protein